MNMQMGGEEIHQGSYACGQLSALADVNRMNLRDACRHEWLQDANQPSGSQVICNLAEPQLG